MRQPAENSYRKPGTVGPNIAVVASNHRVLDHFRADQLVVHVALPGHGGLCWWSVVGCESVSKQDLNETNRQEITAAAE